MPARCSFDYAAIRVVPRVEREEFVNAGVVLLCAERDFLAVRIELARERLRALFPGVDVALVEEHLAAFQRVAAGGAASGPIGQLSTRERFHWLVAPRSTIIQVGPVHSGTCDDPERAVEKLLAKMVVLPAPRGV